MSRAWEVVSGRLLDLFCFVVWMGAMTYLLLGRGIPK